MTIDVFHNFVRIPGELTEGTKDTRFVSWETSGRS